MAAVDPPILARIPVTVVPILAPNTNGSTAVKDKAVYSIDANSSSRPTQNIIKALKEMSKAVYPDEYKDK